MIYQLYKLEFLNHVRFGKRSLNDVEYTLHADTLYSALYIEALKVGKQEEFYDITKNGAVTFSDAFPYRGNELYIPKPYIKIKNQENQGNSSEKKKYKKIKYIPADQLSDWVNGTFQIEEEEHKKEFGHADVKVSVAVRGKEEPEPYRVRYYSFEENCGLYFIVSASDKQQLQLIGELLETLSYSGIGGKRYSGMGRFEVKMARIPEHMEKQLNKQTKRYLLLSTALPEEKELENVMEHADYQLLKRSGFVASENYADQQMRKRDLYVFQAGSCFGNTFKGDIYDVSEGGSHPVYRYAKGLFMGVDV